MSKDAEDTKAALRMLCQSLAVGTDPAKAVHVDDAFLRRLAAAGRAQHAVPGGGTVRGYQSVGTILNAFSGSPPFSVRFMETVGRDMIAYDRESYAQWRGKPVAKDLGKWTPINNLGTWAPLGDLTRHYDLGPLLNPRQQLPAVPYDGRTDVLGSLLSVAAADSKGAQALLDYTPAGQHKSYLEYLLHERRSVWARTDHGASLGQTMRAAMSGHDGTSQKLFKEMTELVGNDVRQFYSYDKDHKLKFTDPHGQADDLSGMRYSLGEIMRAHLEDLDNSLAANKMGLKGPLDPADIDALFAEVAQDDQVFAALVRDQVGRTRAQIDRQYATGKGIDALLISEGNLFGHLLAMRREVLISHGVKVDAANAQMKSYIDQGIGLVPVPYADLFGNVSKGVYEQAVTSGYGKVGDWLAKQGEQGGGSAEQDAKTASDEQAVLSLLRQMSLGASVDYARDVGAKAAGESFADRRGKILPPEKWVGDSEKVNAFVKWCKKNNFEAPRISEDIESTINNSRKGAVSSFNAESGELAG
ncbi:hypothetical protein [Actinomadura sp. HBU206391]|uniref:hypothetical protein n=1 Tax=Actinomadura sp. HBU206391 TaxID=2731692 RepID=UPI0016501B0A|nr:hypothetical protein [Actinomadura sp. HBU206391]MBC6462095.1 hypothetical protein [Actinomadura sp. HBU206391]